MELKIIVRGGAVSQLLSVAGSIYCKKIYGRNCELVYEDHKMLHTQGFALAELLSENESLTIIKPQEQSQIVMGRFLGKVPTCLEPVLTPIRSIYSFLLLLRAKLVRRFRVKSRDDTLKEKFPGEIGILDKVTNRINSINVTLSAEYIFLTSRELSKRFEDSSLANPFLLLQPQPEICVHLRLGDMRTIPRWMESHGVISPISISNLMYSNGIDAKNDQNVLVISDEPDVAKSLLKEFGFSNWNVKSIGNVWNDLQLMASSRFFIGSFSTVSFVAAAIRRHHGLGPAFLPQNSRRQKLHRKARNDYDSYFRARYLSIDHPVYSM